MRIRTNLFRTNTHERPQPSVYCASLTLREVVVRVHCQFVRAFIVRLRTKQKRTQSAAGLKDSYVSMESG